MTTNKSGIGIPALAAIGVLLIGTSAQAATKTWANTDTTLQPDGLPAASQAWSIGSNWNLGTVPADGDDVQFWRPGNAAAVGLLDTTTNVAVRFISGYGSQFFISPTGNLVLSNADGRMTLGNTAGGNTINVAEGGQITWSGAGTATRNITLNNGAILNMAGTAQVPTSISVNSGTTMNILPGAVLGAGTELAVFDSVRQSGGAVQNTPVLRLATGTYEISGGSVTTDNTTQGLYFQGATESEGGTLRVVGSGATDITFGGYRNNVGVNTAPTFDFVLDNSAAHISTVNFTANGISGAALRTSANLDVSLSGGVLLSAASNFTLIDRVSGTDTAWLSGPSALWTDTTSGTKELITIGLNVAQDKGDLDGSGFESLSFTSAALGYVDLENFSNPFVLGLNVTGGTLGNFTSALTAAGISWSVGSGSYAVHLNLDPTVSGGNFFAWDLSTIDAGMGIQGLAVIPEPGSALLVVGALLVLVLARRRRQLS